MGAVAVTDVAIIRAEGNAATDASDHLAIEEPLELHLLYSIEGQKKKQSVSVTMRTPGADAELSAGFLFTEGILKSSAQIATIGENALGENTILITLTDDAAPVLQKAERNFYTTSSCGVCGKASIEAIKTVSPYPIADDDISLPPTLFYELPGRLRQQQAVFERTGGLHASAFFTLAGEFIALREDVGRHNALDKLIGAAFLENELPLDNVILLLSGRASFELVQKAAMAGVRVIAAVGAPSSLAVELAAESGITLIGFLRGERFNVYTGKQRIQLPLP